MSVNFNNFSQGVLQTNIRQADNIIIKPKPFIKWVGGKRSIINELLKNIPQRIENYYEPFAGGGALFFEIYNSVKGSCYLSDLNVNLIVAYNVIKKEPSKLIELLNKYQENHNKEYYYAIRERGKQQGIKQ
jgi:DNA adenine methylase